MLTRAAKTWSACCTANGCQFLREGLGQKEAARQATSHGQVAGPGHAVVLVNMAKSSESKENSAG